MTCQTCRFYRPDTCRRRSPSATGWPFVQPDDTCGEWEAAVAIPEAMQQLGETIGKIRDVVGVATAWRNDRLPTVEDAGSDGCVWVVTGDTDPGALSYGAAQSWWFADPANRYWAPGNLPAPTDPPPDAEPPEPPATWRNDRPPMAGDAGSDGTVWVWINGIRSPLASSWEVVASEFRPGRLNPPHWLPGHKPALTDPPPGWEPPTPPAPRWIVDRVPTVEDGNDDGDVAALMRPGLAGVYGCVTWQCVHPGTPWAPTNAIPDEPFDPTTLDRNGWIRSRLPGKGDIDRDGEVKVPPRFSDMWMWFKASHIVPGQPWAPADSSPGEYQP